MRKKYIYIFFVLFHEFLLFHALTFLTSIANCLLITVISGAFIVIFKMLVFLIICLIDASYNHIWKDTDKNGCLNLEIKYLSFIYITLKGTVIFYSMTCLFIWNYAYLSEKIWNFLHGTAVHFWLNVLTNIFYFSGHQELDFAHHCICINASVQFTEHSQLWVLVLCSRPSARIRHSSPWRAVISC